LLDAWDKPVKMGRILCVKAVAAIFYLVRISCGFVVDSLMNSSYQSISLSVNVQLLLTVFLVVFLWALYSRLRRADFFRWWAWAWTSFAVYLACAALSMQLGAAWTPLKTGFVALLLLTGFLEPLFLILGGWDWRVPGQLSRKWIVRGVTATVLASAACFVLGFLWRNEPLTSMALRNFPRTVFLASALFFCASVFLTQSRAARSWAGLITGLFCFTYSLDQVVYSLTFLGILVKRFAAQFPFPFLALENLEALFQSRVLFLDLVNTCGICMGIVLLLIEQYQRSEKDLEESHRRSYGLVEMNSRLQSEIQERLRIEQALRESESRYRDLVESSEDLIATHDFQGRILSVNPAPAKRLGYEVSELLKMNIRDLLAPRVRSEFRDFLQRVISTGSDRGRMVVLTRSGEERTWEYSSTLRSEGVSSPIIRGMARDITEKVRAEEALQLSEAKFATAFRNSPSAMAITSLRDRRYVDVNQSFEKQLEYTREESIGHTAVELGIWVDPEEFSKALDGIRETGRTTRAEARLRTKSGRVLTVQYSAEIIQIGKELYRLATGEDITEQRRTEDALRESENKFRLVAETAACGIWILQNERLVYLNREVETLTGYSRVELQAMNAWELVHPEFKPILQERSKIRQSSGHLLSRFQYKIVTKSGEERWLELSDSVMEYEGKPAILATAFDVTATRRAESELRDHAMFLDALIFNSPFGIVIKDEYQRVRFCNPAFERMFQFSQSEIEGMDLDELIAPHDRGGAARLTGLSRETGVVHATTQRCRKDGTLLDVELHGVRLFSDSKFVGAFAFYQDISERKRSEEKLQALRSRLTRAQEEERARIARDLHDDTGQRLALLSIDLEQLKQFSVKSQSALTPQLDSLVRIASEITSDVHNVSRRLHPSQVELLGLVRALANFCKDFASRNSMEIRFVHPELASNPSPDVALCLFRVAQESIRNVHKHSGVREAILELKEVSGALHLRVSDSGAGFDPASLDSAPGIGLLSMEERLRSMGGELAVQSTLGGGTTVEASIPLSPAVPA
jgi:two-component system, NarL family, sensor kinase